VGIGGPTTTIDSDGTEDHCRARTTTTTHCQAIVDGTQRTIVENKQANKQTKKHGFPYYLSQVEFMIQKERRNEETLGMD
jgi:hypothetical protein